MLKIDRLSETDSDRQNIVNSARQTLGYINFELSSYERALEYFNKVSPDFHEYPDALIAKGWSFLKLNDYQSALNSMNNLINNYPDYYNVEEANFIRGQCYLKLGYYDFAITEFDKLLNKEESIADSVNLRNESQKGLAEYEHRIDELTKELQQLESKLIESIPFQPSLTRNQENEETIKIQEARENLMKKILSEREEFNEVSDKIVELKKRNELNEVHKKWMAYAEYGKVRAQFLKSSNSN